jgi:hypothetical protein
MLTLLFIVIFGLGSCKNEEAFLSIDYVGEIKFSPAAKDEEVRYIRVNTNQMSWNVTSNKDWCIVNKKDDGFIISAKANPSPYNEKKAQVEIKSEGIKPIVLNVSQDPVMLNITSQNEYYFGEDGGAFEINISCNTDWYLTKDKDWITCSQYSGYYTNPYTVRIDVIANVDNITDSATIQIRAGDDVREITIHREAKKKIYKIGDLYPDDSNPIGIVFSISNNGREGKIFSLNREYSTIWSSEYYSTYARSIDDGQYNTEIIQQRLKETSHNYPAFEECTKLGNGWYLPSCYEMLDIYSCWNGGSEDVNQTARDDCNDLIEQYGGFPIALEYYHYYITSTEFDENKYVYVDFNDGSYETDRVINTFLKQITGRVRPVRKF